MAGSKHALLFVTYVSICVVHDSQMLVDKLLRRTEGLFSPSHVHACVDLYIPEYPYESIRYVYCRIPLMSSRVTQTFITVVLAFVSITLLTVTSI